LCTSEEVIIDTKKEKMSHIYSTVWPSPMPHLKINNRRKRTRTSKLEIASLKHQVQYYQEVGGVENLKKDLLEEHDKCLKVQEDLVMKALSLQEESLLLGITYKEVLRWAEKGARALDRVKFIREVQKDKGVKDHNIELLSDE
jgi:hypothetical protein